MTKPHTLEQSDRIKRQHVDEALSFSDPFNETFRDLLLPPAPSSPPNSPAASDKDDSHDEPDRDLHPTQP